MESTFDPAVCITLHKAEYEYYMPKFKKYQAFCFRKPQNIFL